MDWLSELINGIFSTYASFFNWEHLSGVLTSPVSWGVIGTLIILEGLLSADNALVLAVMVKHLPKDQQKKVLLYGLVGAYVFRFLAIGVGVYLVQITWIKVVGALYLILLAVLHFVKKKPAEGDEVKVVKRSFWGAVAATQLMDIAFSIDSVLAAFGVSDEVWVLFLGGILGVLMMRGVAHAFLGLLERIPELEAAAFVLIFLIGSKMLAGVFGIHVPHVVFFSVMAAVFGGTFLLNYLRNKGKQGRNVEKEQNRAS